MNRKGQFSIIAALLVAVILIATVIITYSTIRNSPIQDQPQILSAIDETNLALKQILGFTIGYYGSVLQVTGNASFAKEQSIEYLQSGLVNIANMHPEWGTSFNLTSVDLSTYWYTNDSWSRGTLAINYSLTGLGLYGVTYETSCKLAVQVKESTLLNQTHLIITKDEDEPLINLGKENLKFYHYVYENSTWKKISPLMDASITAYPNGTYLINMSDPELSKIDPYSYIVQVEDPRGIIVMASSFSRYVCTLTWNSTLYPSMGAVNVTLIDRESFEGIWPPLGWTETGRWNNENNQAFNGTYSADFDGSGSGDLTTFNLNCYGANSIYVDFWYRDEGCESDEFLLRYYDGSGWDTIADLGSTTNENQWLHYQQVVTDSQYFKSNFQIRWSAYNVEDGEHAYVDYVTVTVNKQEISMTIVVELLQNGTMRWLGQNLQLTTQAKPIPPIPVKAIHVSQTINGIDQEVPFQIEDWASDYKIPLGLTSNASVFSNRHMIVFLVNPNVSKITIWWNGSDTTTQTPYAYTNRYFTGDNPSSGVLTNGILTLTIEREWEEIYQATVFKVTSNIGGSTATARFMRINMENSTYGADAAYVIHHGIVRDIIHQEAEWSGGAVNCPNLYAHIVLTLPTNATYYTYQLRLMFINSTQPRTITDLCPIRITASSGTYSALAENGTANGYPIVSSFDLFYNMSNIWQHHWAQLNSSATRGFGIMFTDTANEILYGFDAIAGENTGALSVNSTLRAIELLPVASALNAPVSFQYSLDVCWYGAVATFDGTTSIYNSSNQLGLWVLVECPPTITVTTEN